MLDKFRTLSTTWIAKVLLALITIPFALFGINYYFQQGGSGNVVVKVNGNPITMGEFQDTLNLQMDQMRESLKGASIDPGLLDRPELRYQVLQSLVTRQLLVDYADAHHLAVPDDLLIKEISQVGAFQDNGRFSQARYEAVLRSKGMTPAIFESRLRNDIKVQLQQASLTTTQWVPQVSLDAFIRLDGQTRTVVRAALPYDRFLPQAQVDDAAVAHYYATHSSQFEVPERVKVEYVVFSQNQLASGVPVSPDEVAKAYADPANQARWHSGETRRASHILMAFPPKATAEQKAATKDKALKVLAEVKAHPDRFAALARADSQDPGSAAQGGDLGYFGRGVMVPAFENAVFAMKPGEITGPVESPFGYHIIRLQDVKGGGTKTLADATPELTQQIRNEKAARLFSDQAEGFGNLVYEQSTSLKPVETRFGLTPKTSDWISSGVPVPDPLLDNAKLRKALFSPEVLKEGHNTEAVEVAPNVLVAARVTAHEPSSQRPLAEVKARIADALRRQAAARLAHEAGEKILADLKAGKTVALDWSTPLALSRDKALEDKASSQVMRAVFSMDGSKTPGYAGVDVPERGHYTLVQLVRVAPGNPADPEVRMQAQTGLVRAYSDEVMLAFLNGLRDKADIRLVNKSVLEGNKSGRN